MRRVKSGYDTLVKKGGDCQLNDVMQSVGTNM